MGGVYHTDGMQALSTACFGRFRQFFHRSTGILYAPEKRSLVENRLLSRLVPLGEFTSFDAMADALDAPGQDELREWVLDRMTTHYSYFFREPVHFRFLQDRLARVWPERRDVRILSAACAAGQEAWSMAMIIRGLGHEGVTIEGIDVAPDTVRRAREGRYPAGDVVPYVSPAGIHKYFISRQDGTLQVAPFLRPLCSFRVLNLMDAQSVPARRYDIVFLRNVLIYFRPPERQVLLEQIHRVLRPGGFLVISLSETLDSGNGLFRHRHHSIYSPLRSLSN